jgi:GH15 family glucan-1,4-alpha-glucosidase
LSALDGRLDWWPAPALDSPPVFASILDPTFGGYMSLSPADPYEVERRYVEGTNVLQSTYRTPGGEAVVTQALNSGSAGRLPWTEIASRLEGKAGEVRFRWHVVPGNRFGQAKPWVRHFGGTPVVVLGDQYLAVVVGSAGAAMTEDGKVTGELRIGAGDRALVGVVATDAEPLYIPAPDEIDARIDRSIASWQGWSSLLAVDGPWRDAVIRSALALKTLLREDTGAIAAAATTSLPEQIGGAKNWDYRYSWIRDSSFAVDALIRLTLHEEAHGAVSWLLDAIKNNGGDLHVFYTLSGGIADREEVLEAPGYRGSRPVRAGNLAADQIQLGTYGDLFDAIHRYCIEGHFLDDGTARMLADMADSCCDQWMSRDSGIWELDQLEHYTISKIGCWTALDRAVSLAEAGQIPNDHLDRWKIEAGEVRRWIETNCWSEAQQSYTFYAGTELLDAAVLLAGRTGFDRGPRLASTAEAICGQLARGPMVYRYSGMEDEEGAFVACSFWLAEALAHTGQFERAEALMDAAVGLANDVGILAEQINPSTGAFLGNVPQALSHLALINASYALQHRSETV